MYNKTMKSKAISKAIILISAVFTVLSAGCGNSTIRYVNPSANFSYIKKVAVLPFNNFSDDRYAGERVRSAIIVDLMSRGIFEVVEQGEVVKVISGIFRETGIEEGRAVQVDRETLKLIGERLGVQAIILGSVDEYTGSVGATGIVSISLRMIDASSGIVLWQAKSTKSSRSVWRKLIGIEEVDRAELTRDAVESAIDSLL